MQRNFTGTFGDDPERIVLPVYLQVALLLTGQFVIEFVGAWKDCLLKLAWYKGKYYATTLSQINAEDYSLIGWYDAHGSAAGGKIRVLVAVKKD